MRHNLDKESENTDRWLVSYADFITLLFAFFVVMYSVSAVNEGKFKVLSETLVDAFVQPERSLQPIQIGEVNRSETETSGDAVYPADYFGEPATPESQQAFEELQDEFSTSLQQLIEDDVVKLRSNEHWFAIDIRDKGMLFPGGSDEIRAGGRELIKTIADGFRGKPNEIHIRGYTDSEPIRTRRFSSNWALSTARAVAVLELMQAEGIAPERMVPQGYGEYQPVAPNDTPEGRAMNRRIVILMSKYPPAKSELERQAIEEATRELQGGVTTPTGVQNGPPQSTPPGASQQTSTQTAPQQNNIRLIRAPDGTLIIRSADEDDEPQDDNSN
jgi:chemotaxis protein MotB